MDLAGSFLVNLLLAQVSACALLSLFIPARRLLAGALPGVVISFGLAIVLLLIFTLWKNEAPPLSQPVADGQTGLGEGLILIAMFAGAYTVFLGVMIWKLLKIPPR